MKKSLRYNLAPIFFIARSNSPLPSPFYVLHDGGIRIKKTDLEKLFFNAHKVLRVRLRDLGNLDRPTTNNDADAMRVVLEGLISAKRQIRKERGE
jgi:hypothetical protein